MTSEATTTRVNEGERDMEKKITQPAALDEQPQFRTKKVLVAKQAQLTHEKNNYSRQAAGEQREEMDAAINGVEPDRVEKSLQPVALLKARVAVSINAAQEEEDDLTDSEEERFFSVRGSSYLRKANDEAQKNLTGGSDEVSLCCSDEDDLETVRKYEVTVTNSLHRNNNQESTYHLNANSSILGPQQVQIQFKDHLSKSSKRLMSKEQSIGMDDHFQNDDNIYLQKTALNHPQSPLPVRNHQKAQLRTLLTSINDQRQPKLQSQLSEISKNTKTSTSQKSSDHHSSKSHKSNNNLHEIESSRSVNSHKKNRSQKQSQSAQKDLNILQEQETQNLAQQRSGRGVTKLHREPSQKVESKNCIQDGSNQVNDSLRNSSSSSSSDKTQDGVLPEIKKHSIKKKRDRVDIYGHPIKRGGKKHRVVFADHKHLGKPLYLIHEVESFKKYNTDMSARGSSKACCSIF